MQTSGAWSTVSGSRLSSQTSSDLRSLSGSLGTTLRDSIGQVHHNQPTFYGDKPSSSLSSPFLQHQKGLEQRNHNLEKMLTNPDEGFKKVDSSAYVNLIDLDEDEPSNEKKFEGPKRAWTKRIPSSMPWKSNQRTNETADAKNNNPDVSNHNKLFQIPEVLKAQIRTKKNETEPENEKVPSDALQVQFPPPPFQRTSSAPAIQLHPDDETEPLSTQPARPKPHPRATLPLLPKNGNAFMQKLSYMSPRAKSRVELLCNSAESGEVPSAKALIEAGAEINGVGQNAYTPLGIAVKEHQAEMASFLLQQGADVNSGWKAKWTKEFNRQKKGDVRNPIHLAAEVGSPELVDLLVRHGANVNDASGCVLGQKRRVPLHFACNRDVMKSLLAHGATEFGVASEHPDDQPPLCEAILQERVSCVQTLLEHNVSIGFADPEKVRAMTQACSLHGSTKSFEIIGLLITHGASMNPRIVDGRTISPLSIFCSKSPALNQYDIASVQALISAGAAQDQSALDNALRSLCEHSRFEDVLTRHQIMQLLLSVGANAHSAKALFKILAVYIFHGSSQSPSEEQLLEQFLKLSIPLIKTETSGSSTTDEAIPQIQSIQSTFQRGSLPFPGQFGEFWFDRDDKDGLQYLNNKLAHRRMEVALVFLNWTHWARENFGLQGLELHTADFWGTLGKTGISPRKTPTERTRSTIGSLTGGMTLV